LTLQGQIRKLVLSFYLLWYCKYSSCDPLDKPWVVPIVTKLRDTFDLSTKGECLEVMPIQSDPNVASTSTNRVDPMEE